MGYTHKLQGKEIVLNERMDLVWLHGHASYGYKFGVPRFITKSSNTQ